MLKLIVVHLDTRKILILNNLYIIHYNYEKKWWQDVLNFTTRYQMIDWLFSYDLVMLLAEILRSLKDFNKCCRGLLFGLE